MAGIHNLGVEWVVDVGNCDAANLRDIAFLSELFGGLVAELRLNVVGTPVFHTFPGEGGITGMLLLAESHLCFHTFPEFRVLTLNLYSCRGGYTPNFHALLATLGSVEMRVREVARGFLPGENGT